MTLGKHITHRFLIFGIILSILGVGFYLKYLLFNDGKEIFQFLIGAFIWLFLSGSFLLYESSELKQNLNNKKKRRFNLITGISIFTIIGILILQFIIGAAKVF
ncbi:hypothetical protein [Christiangramia sabulilitoris]|uniref:Uncharacterized protein n=1 Tax=Christiangramia sabulilitoris TaxID=2583991 RepID=A0A550I7J6_9FLAO|nr:hypothetical protein [Christiangramia sabulilitoris]TRO66798.1 hypothetical protein FGM01_02590 [Christiangramia sabulilitoris]